MHGLTRKSMSPDFLRTATSPAVCSSASKLFSGLTQRPVRAGNHDTFPPVVLLVAALGVLFYGLLGLTLGASWRSRALLVRMSSR